MPVSCPNNFSQSDTDSRTISPTQSSSHCSPHLHSYSLSFSCTHEATNYRAEHGSHCAAIHCTNKSSNQVKVQP